MAVLETTKERTISGLHCLKTLLELNLCFEKRWSSLWFENLNLKETANLITA
jgi:hypothetical protein